MGQPQSYQSSTLPASSPASSLPASVIAAAQADSPSTTLARRLFLSLLVLPLLTAASAQLRIPTELGVPFTLQTAVVVLAGAWMGPLFGCTAMLAYLTYGLIGLPFFAMGDGTGSLSYLMSVTGGYLLAFPITALLVGWLGQASLAQRSFLARMAILTLGSYFLLAFGSAFVWLVLQDPAQARNLFILFAPLALVKVAIGSLAWWPRA